MAYKGIQGLRRSQTISTFGPGAIVDLRHSSIMMAGIDYWNENAIDIHEPHLERILRVSGFKTPSTMDISQDGKDIPAVIFPKWMVCPKCDRLAPYDFFAGGLHKPGNQLKCRGCNINVYPARLIVACPKGHIDDFPWIEWTHLRDHKPVCSRPVLFLHSRGFTSSLSDLQIECKTCGAKTNLGSATQEDELSRIITQCSGNQPWLMRSEGGCPARVRPLQRGASNVYFSVISSSISIPPWSKAVQITLDRNWNMLKYVPEEALVGIITGMNLTAKLNMKVEDIINAIQERKIFEKGSDTGFSEGELRYREAQALRRPSANDNTQGEFENEESKIDFSISKHISKVMLVERLREVRALRGFTRVDAPDPSAKYSGQIAQISNKEVDWLPAIEVRGEGIYLELNEEKIQTWIAGNAIIRDRAHKLNETYIEICERRNWTVVRTITPRLLLVHSLAHALIRQLAVNSGYSSASLRERLYVFEPEEMNGNSGIAGLLIYTSTPDSEGSLGGLVRQGKPDRFSGTLKAAIQEAVWCSSDPLCIDSTGQGPDATNLAACHACLLLSETCCEEFNRFLDRAMLVGTLKHPEAGFFRDLME